MAAYSLGMEYAALGQQDAAVAANREALRIWPDYPEAHSNLAIALLALGQKDEALTHLEAAIRLKPELLIAESNLANVLLSLPDRQAEAIAHYQHILRQHPNCPKCR